MNSKPLAISKTTTRRFVLGRQGLWPGRRWAGLEGTVAALRTAEAVQMDPCEAHQRLGALVQTGDLSLVEIEGSKDQWYVLAEDLPRLEALEAGEIPPEWQPVLTTTKEEAVFLAPLDIVSARGRASWLFDFEYVWEVYKPKAKRRWGYYTLPVLYDDRLVARLDPKLERASGTLLINGFWLEDAALGEEPGFTAALGRGLESFCQFLQVKRINIAAINPPQLQRRINTALKNRLEV